MYVRFEAYRNGVEKAGFFDSLLNDIYKKDNRSNYFRRWFDKNLEGPNLLEYDPVKFYFRAEARLHLKMARKMVKLLMKHGYAVKEIWTKNLSGEIVYEDEHQVAVGPEENVAKPTMKKAYFWGDFTISKKDMAEISPYFNVKESPNEKIY